MTKILAPLLMLLGLGASLGLAADELPVLVYPCPRAAAPPLIDGRLDDPCWQAAPAVDSFSYFDRDEPAAVQTFFRAAFDDSALYLAITCDEPTPQRVSVIAVPRDEVEIFGREAVEVFLDPNHTHRRFYQLGVNPAGSLYDAGPDLGGRWDGNVAVAADLREGTWHVELAIPWQSLGVTPEAGQVHGINVCRDRYIGAGPPWSSWARVMGTFHDPLRFGHLVPAPTAEQVGKLGAELRKDGRTGPIRIATAQGLGDTSYRALLQGALDLLDARIAELRAVGNADRDPAVRRAIEARLAAPAAEAAPARAALAAESVAPEIATRLESRLNRICAELDEALWQVRLEALFSQI